jgi:hypothetical protein
MTPSYAETLRPRTSESTAAAPATEAPLGITRPPALNGNPVGERVELGRYRVPDGERIIYGQRVDGVVRFLPEEPVVLDPSSGPSEGSTCCPRESIREAPPPGAARQKRAHDAHANAAAGAAGRGRTGVRVELARYSMTAGDRVLYGQRVDGVVRLTDVPLGGGGRAYLVERGLEEEGSNADAALQALIADYLRQARVLDAVPMAGRRGAV